MPIIELAKRGEKGGGTELSKERAK